MVVFTSAVDDDLVVVVDKILTHKIAVSVGKVRVTREGADIGFTYSKKVIVYAQELTKKHVH